MLVKEETGGDIYESVDAFFDGVGSLTANHFAAVYARRETTPALERYLLRCAYAFVRESWGGLSEILGNICDASILRSPWDKYYNEDMVLPVQYILRLPVTNVADLKHFAETYIELARALELPGHEAKAALFLAAGMKQLGKYN